MGCAASSANGQTSTKEANASKKTGLRYSESNASSNQLSLSGRSVRAKSSQSDRQKQKERNREMMEKRKLYLSKMKAASPFAHELAPFVPWSVIKYFKTEGDATYGLWKFSAAVMVVDITGFTRLGETLAKLPGMLGVELLATYINGYFAQLIDVIVAYGGSVEKFAGDALIVVFGSQFGEVPLESLNAAALNCAMAIQQKHGKYPVKVSWGGCEEELELTVHIGIGVSPNMRTVTVGGLGGSWRKLMLGNVFSQLATSVPLAGSSEVVISKQSAEFVRRSKTADMFVIEERRAESACEQEEATDFAVRLKDGLSASHLPSGKALPDLVISTAMEKGVRGFVDLFVQSRIDEGQPQISESRTLSILFIGINGWDDLSQSVTSTSTEGFSTLHQLTRSIQQIVYTYEGCIANFLVDEKGCSVIITYGIPQHPDDALLAIRSALDMKEASSKLGVGLSIAVTTGEIFVGTIGSSRRKDFSIMGSPVNLAARLMGLCSQIHADQASEKWRSERRSQAPTLSEAKCMREAACEVPRIDRDDASVSGSEMDQNIWSQIVVDEKTFQLTKRTTLYRTDLEPIEVRGCEAKQCVYAPVQLFRGRRDFEAHQRAVGEGGEDPFVEDEEREIVLISRSTELRALEEMRDEVAMKNPLPSPKMPSAARTRIAFVHAEGGMGKSYLIRVCIAPVEKREIPGLVLESQQTHQGSKDSLFSIWEPVYKQLLLSNRPPLSSKKQHLLDFFKVLSKTEEYGMEFGYMENFDLSCCLALLNPVLKTRFSVPAAVADLGSVLRVKTQACLLHLILKHFSQTQPLFILFDQFELCLDMPSLELLQRIAESKDKLSPIMIVCSMRPVDTTAASVATLEAQRVLQKIQSCETAMTVNLRPLTEQVATELFLHLLNGQLRSHLEVPELKECDPALAKFVYNNSQNGKTYLLVAIVNVCRDNLIDERTTTLGTTGNRLHMLCEPSDFTPQLPESVRHFARSTIDRLQPAQQLLVKHAAVIGLKFSMDTLVDIYPKSQAEVLSGLMKLQDQHVFMDAAECEGSSECYRFVDPVIQEEAYSMILHEERKLMHRKLAERMDRKVLVAREEDRGLKAERTAQLAKHWAAYVTLAEGQSTYEDVSRALECLRDYADWLKARGEYTNAYDQLFTAHRFLPLLKKKDTKGDDNDWVENTMDEEIFLLSEMATCVQNERLRYGAATALQLHQRVLAVEVDSICDTLWELRFRSYCGWLVEAARSERYSEVNAALQALEKTTQEAGGKVERVVANCAILQALCGLAGKTKETLELAEETLVSLHNMPDACTVFATPAVAGFFLGLSSGHPQVDIQVTAVVMHALLGNYLPSADIGNMKETALHQGLKGLNESAMPGMLCSPLRLLRRYDLLRPTAELALEIGSKTGDHMAVTFANFHTYLLDGQTADAYALLMFLEKALGSLYLERCLLLECVLEMNKPVLPVVEIMRCPPTQTVFAPELMRLQASLFPRLLLEDENVFISGKVLESDCFSKVSAFVLSSQESLLIDAVEISDRLKLLHFLVPAAASLLVFWHEHNLLQHTPHAAAVFRVFTSVREKAQGAPITFPPVVKHAAALVEDNVVSGHALLELRTLEARNPNEWEAIAENQVRSSPRKGDT